MNNRDFFYKEEPEYRKVVIEQLINHLSDPGLFPILLLGKRGSGKSHWLEKIIEHKRDLKNIDCLEKLITVNSWIAKDKEKDFWEEQFKKADKGLLVIDDIEELSKKTQAILYTFLSTINGKYGWDEKKYQCRLVFTSTFEINTLRDREQYLLQTFFDRISQFVVKLPSFKDHNKNTWTDFASTWRKMQFPQCNFPNEEFKKWINQNSHKFHGNFRDLDKLAINWQNCRTIGLDENNTFMKVTKDFFELYHFPENNSENDNAFYINADQDFYKEILPHFRNFVKSYAKKLYGLNLSKAPYGKPLGVPWRTMDRW